MSRQRHSDRYTEILVDAAVAQPADGKRPLVALGTRPIKGYDGELAVFRIVLNDRSCAA